MCPIKNAEKRLLLNKKTKWKHKQKVLRSPRRSIIISLLEPNFIKIENLLYSWKIANMIMASAIFQVINFILTRCYERSQAGERPPERQKYQKASSRRTAWPLASWWSERKPDKHAFLSRGKKHVRTGLKWLWLFRFSSLYITEEQRLFSFSVRTNRTGPYFLVIPNRTNDNRAQTEPNARLFWRRSSWEPDRKLRTQNKNRRTYKIAYLDWLRWRQELIIAHTKTKTNFGSNCFLSEIQARTRKNWTSSKKIPDDHFVILDHIRASILGKHSINN